MLAQLQVTAVRLGLDGAAGTCRDLSGKYHRFLVEAGCQAMLACPEAVAGRHVGG
jgi:hypothetical protein